MTEDHQYLPVLLNCKGRSCLIIGGGKVAERKAIHLLDVGASVHIVSPVLRSETLQRLANKNVLRWTKREYQADDLTGVFLVYAATDDSKLNLEIAANADRLGVLVNIASHGEKGTFITPAVLRRGRLTLAVSTSGAGPRAARDILQQLEEQFGPEYEEYLDFLYEMRTMIKQEVACKDARSRLLDKVYGIDLLGEIRLGGYEPWNADKMKQWIEINREE
ncbi:precorrin-2 dehydrogenase/sirohydrochlorin ferrochelatase family protein [Paenibacillus solani]|uniref:precorrin-2 dehydrogenase n=1 Tax=Paenibacillus solani TaxID=1705565 RepID=A0A0M1P1M1_9BACL|nr:bifunctional precorrin-2 dehydrogenase/sirohydrochlorin ferrochelatase [Paenibacillus solani]KOR88190.1 siroheme synthase [Paenibacillus solani]